MMDVFKTEQRALHIVTPNIQYVRNNLSNNGRVMYGDGKMNLKNIPNDSGIYLIGEVSYEDDTQYLVHKVKVGQGKNLLKRLNTYTTYTTSIKLFDTLRVHPIMLDTEEERYQNILEQYGWHIGNTEWFVISEQNYQILKCHGFSGFNKLKT